MAVVAEYKGPFGGLNTDNPPEIIQANEAAQCDNFMLRNNYIATRQNYVSLLPALPDGNNCLAITTALNTSRKYYTYGISKANVYALGTGPAWGLVTSGALPANSPINFNSVLNALQSCIFVNGTQFVFQIVDNALGQLTNLYGALYLMELAQTLLIAYTIEGGGTFFPQRIRWCNGGNITQWDPSSFVGAGFTDLLDASDYITGMFAIGSVGYVLRVNGITQVTPTGNGIQPWYFNHLWASENGIGCYQQGSLAQYGALSIFVAQDNVYMFTPNSMDTIADKVMDSITSDLQSYGPYTGGIIYASLVPLRNSAYRYFCYELYICTQFAGMIVWTYYIQSKSWVRSTTGTSGLSLTGQPAIIWANAGPF